MTPNDRSTNGTRARICLGIALALVVQTGVKAQDSESSGPQEPGSAAAKAHDFEVESSRDLLELTREFNEARAAGDVARMEELAERMSEASFEHWTRERPGSEGVVETRGYLDVSQLLEMWSQWAMAQKAGKPNDSPLPPDETEVMAALLAQYLFWVDDKILPFVPEAASDPETLGAVFDFLLQNGGTYMIHEGMLEFLFYLAKNLCPPCADRLPSAKIVLDGKPPKQFNEIAGGAWVAVEGKGDAAGGEYSWSVDPEPRNFTPPNERVFGFRYDAAGSSTVTLKRTLPWGQVLTEEIELERK